MNCLANISVNNSSNGDLILRRFEVKDQDQVVRLIDHVCAESDWMATKRFTPTPSWLHAFSEPTCAFHLLLIAESDSNIVGWCRLFPEKCKYVDVVELGIGILSDYRHKTLGSSFIGAMFAWARNVGAKRIELSVHVDNHIAVYLFKKFNFEVVSTNSEFFLMSANV